MSLKRVHLTILIHAILLTRRGIFSSHRLRDEVLHLIARVKLSKYEIARRIFWHGICGDVEFGDLDFLIQQNEDMLYHVSEVPDSDFTRQLHEFESTQRERRANRGITRSTPLYPPGKITHLVKTGQSKSCIHGLVGCLTCGASNAGSEYTPIHKENDDFNEIEIRQDLLICAYVCLQGRFSSCIFYLSSALRFGRITFQIAFAPR